MLIRYVLRTDSESVETTVRRRGIVFAGFKARLREERLPRSVMFGKMLGGKGYSGGQEWDCMKDLEEDRQAFGIKLKGGARPHKTSADGSDGSRKRRRSSCGNGTAVRRKKQPSDTGRLQPRL